MYKRVLVPLDGSPVSETILPWILELAEPLDMEVVLLRVLEPVPPTVIEGSRHVVVENVEARRTEAEKYLAPFGAELVEKGVRARTHIRRGAPADEIVAAAREVGADLIAMSTHGRSGLGRLLFGSVAEAVLHHADIPVLLFRATETQVARRGTMR